MMCDPVADAPPPIRTQRPASTDNAAPLLTNAMIAATLLLASSAAHYHTEPYDTDALVRPPPHPASTLPHSSATCCVLTLRGALPRPGSAQVEQLRVGHHMDVEGVPADFECAWRTAAMAHAKELQPTLTTAQQKTLFDALELGAAGDDHKGHQHPPCQKAHSFADLSWEPALRSEPQGPRAGELALHAATAEELLAALDAAAAHSGPARITLQADTVYRLNETLVLGPEHSHTTIHSETLGGAATISGSKLLSGLKWSPVAVGNVSK